MRHVSRTQRDPLDWFDRINFEPKIQIKYIDFKNQLADTLTKGNFTRDEWSHLLCLFNMSHFSFTNCLEVMSKRKQEDAGEERVTAKSKPMMNLVSQCSARNPDVFSSTASESPGKTRHESQISWTEQHLRTGKPVMDASSSNYSDGNLMKCWNQERWDLQVNNQPIGSLSTRTDLSLMIMIWTLNTVTESDMSFKSRSFLHKMNDLVRKMLDQSSKDATQDSNEHSFVWGMLMSSTLQAYVFIGKKYSENFTSHIKIQGTISKWNRCLTNLKKLIVGQSVEIYGISTINWEDSSWKQLSLVNDEEVISLSHAKVYAFSDSVLCVAKMHQNPQSNIAWETSWRGSRVHHNTELWTHLMMSQWTRVECFPRILHIAAL